MEGFNFGFSCNWFLPDLEGWQWFTMVEVNPIIMCRNGTFLLAELVHYLWDISRWDLNLLTNPTTTTL